MFGFRKTFRWNKEPNQQILIGLLIAEARGTYDDNLTRFLVAQDWSPSETRDRLAHAANAIRYAADREVFKRAREIAHDLMLASYRLG
jgi:hypothetical protein